jgi:flagellar hook-associated protein 3 FlgL
MKFTSMEKNLFSAQVQYNDIMEKLASLKMVNRASDNPIAATKIIDIRKSQAEHEQYRNNMQMCDTWISAAESKLSGAFDLLVNAQELAVGQSTATATASTRRIAAQSVDAIIQEMLNLANAKQGDRYLFSGTRNDVDPFSDVEMTATIESAKAARDNAFSGTVTSSGVYTGGENKTYAVKIIAAGPLNTATYQTSTDGGKTWSEMDPPPVMDGTVIFTDGVQLNFGAGNFGENDVFYVNAIAAGYYRGNNEDLTLTINRGANITYNLTGAALFTAAGGSGADIFKTLNALKAALENNDPTGISNLIGNLKNAQEQITLNQSLCGTKLNHLDISKSNLTDLDEKLTGLLSETQDADMTDLATRLAMKEVALKASFSMAGKIGDMTILNFLK